MNNRLKRLLRDLEGIGFERDADASSPRRQMHAYRHPNDTDQVLRVSEHMSDSGCTAAWKKAQSIAGLGTTGSTMPSSIKERARVKRESERAEERRIQRVREQHAQRLAEAQARRERQSAGEQQRREIEDLMQPGNGR